jgi:hypothetical protein
VVQRVQQKLTDMREPGSFAKRNAFLGERGKKLAENVVDVGGGEEIAGERGGELRTELLRFVEFVFLTSVEWAQVRVRFVAEHAAAASVGECELTEMGVPIIGAFCGHKSSQEVENSNLKVEGGTTRSVEGRTYGRTFETYSPAFQLRGSMLA